MMRSFPILHPSKHASHHIRANAELSKQLRDAQNELMSTRSECSGLKTTNYHLQVKVAKLKEQLSEVVAELQTRGERRGRPDEGDATEGGAGAGGGRTLPTEDVQVSVIPLFHTFLSRFRLASSSCEFLRKFTWPTLTDSQRTLGPSDLLTVRGRWSNVYRLAPPHQQTLRNMLALACSQLQAAQQVAESFAAIVPTHQSKPGRSGSCTCLSVCLSCHRLFFHYILIPTLVP